MTKSTLAFILVCLSSTALAIPSQFVHQGRLVDADTGPLSGSHELTFSFFDAATGGEAVWTETLSVSFDDGNFVATLGADSANPIAVSDLMHPELFLSLVVDDGPELMPRHRMAAVPYAMLAGTAEAVAGGTVDAASIAVGGVPVVDDAGNWVGPAPAGTLGSLTCASGEIVGWDGTQFDCLTLPADGLTLLTCEPGDVVGWDGAQFVCQPEVSNPLAQLTCDAGDFVQWDGSQFVCAGFGDASAVAAMGPLDNDNPLHHERYSDAEAQVVADTRIALHAADADAHHTRYSDAEAETVVVDSIIAHSSNEDAHHTRYSDAEAQAVAAAEVSAHAADADAHHVKYTDAEAQAVAAAEVAAHAADADAHHAKYTDAEAQAVAAAEIAAHASDADAHHAKYTDAEAQAVADDRIAAHAVDADAHHVKYTDDEARAAVTSAPLTGGITLSGTLSAAAIDTDGPGGLPAVRIRRMAFSRNGGTTYNFTDVTGTSHSLTVDDTTVRHGGVDGVNPNTHIAFVPGGASDSYLLLNIEGSGGACMLLHVDDDTPRPGMYVATDGGNTAVNVASWGNSTTNTFMLRVQGNSGHVLNANASFAVLCF